MGDDVVAQRERRAEHPEQPAAQARSLTRTRLSSSQPSPAASARRTIARSAVSASGARDSDQSNSTWSSVFQPSRSRSPWADGSTSPSRPTLGSFGRCVAGLATPTTVAHAAGGADRPLQRQVRLQLERRDVAAVVLPLGALVAQEEVEYVLPQRFRDQFGVSPSPPAPRPGCRAVRGSPWRAVLRWSGSTRCPRPAGPTRSPFRRRAGRRPAEPRRSDTGCMPSRGCAPRPGAMTPCAGCTSAPAPTPSGWRSPTTQRWAPRRRAPAACRSSPTGSSPH